MKNLLLFFLLAIVGCGTGFVYETKIVKDYVLIAVDVGSQKELIRVDEKGEFKDSIIEPSIISIGWSDQFIIAKRKPTNDTSNIEWYIIRLSDDKLFGPFDEGGFNRMNKELNVPESIKFKIDTKT